MSVVTLDIVGCSGVVTDEADDGESARLVEAHSSEQTKYFFSVPSFKVQEGYSPFLFTSPELETDV